MNKSPSYKNYMSSQEWASVSWQAKIKYGFKCVCGNTQNIQCHHLYYRPRIEDTKVTDLMPLCKSCHDLIHQATWIKATCNSTLSIEEKRKEIHRQLVDNKFLNDRNRTRKEVFKSKKIEKVNFLSKKEKRRLRKKNKKSPYHKYLVRRQAERL